MGGVKDLAKYKSIAPIVKAMEKNIVLPVVEQEYAIAVIVAVAVSYGATIAMEEALLKIIQSIVQSVEDMVLLGVTIVLAAAKLIVQIENV